MPECGINLVGAHLPLLVDQSAAQRQMHGINWWSGKGLHPAYHSLHATKQA